MVSSEYQSFPRCCYRLNADSMCFTFLKMKMPSFRWTLRSSASKSYTSYLPIFTVNFLELNGRRFTSETKYFLYYVVKGGACNSICYPWFLTSYSILNSFTDFPLSGFFSLCCFYFRSCNWGGGFQPFARCTTGRYSTGEVLSNMKQKDSSTNFFLSSIA